MHIVILIFAWLSPAIVAGALGWPGIWGTGSAFFDFLIPFPTTGGILHVPSFAIAAAVVLAHRRLPSAIARFAPVAAFAVLAASLATQIDAERLHAALFTDFVPYGSPVRLDGNAVQLFVATDAFWVGVYALVAGAAPPVAAWVTVPVVAALIIGFGALRYETGGPIFKIGGGIPGRSRGQEIEAVYTSAAFDEALLREWFEASSLSRPWNSPNAEHTAIHFVNSMQLIEYRAFDEIGPDTAVATICLYEEDRSTALHAGYYDCFAGRSTVADSIAALRAQAGTGLGSDIDNWYALVQFCDGVQYDIEAFSDIESEQICRAMARGFAANLQGFIAQHGAESAQVRFVETEAAARGLAITQ